MPTVVVVGGGFAGCAAAIAVAKAGAEAILLERTDQIGGLALVAGLLEANGSLTAALEAKAMGGGELFEACEALTLHEIDHIEEFGLKHLRIFNVLKVEGAVKNMLQSAGVKVMTRARARAVRMKGRRVGAVLLDDGANVQGDAFVDATGSSGGVNGCTRYGWGCAMCVLRCPTFGGRVSISARAGARDYMARRPDGTSGTLSRSLSFVKESLSADLVGEIEKSGYLLIPLPEKEGDGPKYLRAVDNGYVKVSRVPQVSLEEIRRLPGLENARLTDPLSGGVASLIRNLALASRDNSMKVQGVDNLYCAGDKAGPKGELSPVIAQGLLAGHNAVRFCQGKESLVLPRTTALGDFIAFEAEQVAFGQELGRGFSFEAGPYFQRMKQIGLYSTSPKEIRDRVEKAGLVDLFAHKIAS